MLKDDNTETAPSPKREIRRLTHALNAVKDTLGEPVREKHGSQTPTPAENSAEKTKKGGEGGVTTRKRHDLSRDASPKRVLKF